MSMPRLLRDRLGWIMVALTAAGIGAATLMFAVVNGVVLRPLELPHPEQLVFIGERIPAIAISTTFPWIDSPGAYLAWQRGASDFTGLAATAPGGGVFQVGGRAVLLHGVRVTPNFFPLMGVRAERGRLLTPADATAPSHPIDITDQLWRDQFGADPAVVGRDIGLNGNAATVVGILPASFRMRGRELGPMTAGGATQYFQALQFRPDQAKEIFTDFNDSVIGRLRPGVSRSAALAQLNVIQANLSRQAAPHMALYASLIGVRAFATEAVRPALWLLLAGVLAVLAMICVNLGGLWVARIARGRRDWAIRAALGAEPGRLARQVLGECVTLSLVGGGLGLLLAVIGARVLRALPAPVGMPRWEQIGIDGHVAGFAVLAALAAGVITGWVPALRLRGVHPLTALQAGGSAATMDRAGVRSRQILLGLQSALATLLLTGAGILGFSFWRLVSQPTGFQTAGRVTATINLNAYSRDQVQTILAQIPAKADALPGVASAAFTSHLPLEGQTWIDALSLPRQAASMKSPLVNVRFVSPGYFGAIGIPLLAGRDFTDRDRLAGKDDRVIVLSRAAARLVWPGKTIDKADWNTLLGREVHLGDSPERVIAIAGDTRASFAEPPPAVIYVPYGSQFLTQWSLVARSGAPVNEIAGALRRSLFKIAPAVVIRDIRPLAAVPAAAVAPQKLELTILLWFAVCALLLAAFGVYALVAHGVAQRRKEWAIRIALGADGYEIWRLVLWQALAPVAAGLVAGLILAWAGGHFLEAFVFQVSPADPRVMAAAALVVLIAAGLACVAPAHRATHTALLAALRVE